MRALRARTPRIATAAAGVLALACLAAAGAAPRPLEVRVTGMDYSWTLRYPGPDGRFDTPDDIVDRRHLRLPAHTRVRLELRSEDYVYSFSLPDLDVGDLAVPGRPYRMEFETESPGVTLLAGDQMCGFTHPELMGELIVMTPRAFQEWAAGMAEHTRTGTDPSRRE